MIKQNDIIIQMLIQISNKLEQLDNRIKILEEVRDNDSKLDLLITQINNLKLGEDSGKQIKNKNREGIIIGKICI